MAFYYLKVVKSKNLEFGVLSFWAGPGLSVDASAKKGNYSVKVHSEKYSTW